MKFLNKTATATFARLIEELEYSGKSHRKIENGSYMPLSVEIINQLDNGNKIVSLCHYGEMNGDLMADPEMNFLVFKTAVQTYIVPLYYRNDYMRMEQTSIHPEKSDYTSYRINKRLQADHTNFANGWLKNIKEQGFLEKLQPLLAKW